MAYTQLTKVGVIITTLSASNILAQEKCVPKCYIEYAEVFNKEKAIELPPINRPIYTIKLKEGATPLQGPIYILAEKELDALQEYLSKMTYRGQIRRSVSKVGALILFVLKKDRGLYLYINYQGLNKITIKNRTLLLLISETLDQLSRGKIFTKLDLKDTYYQIRIQVGDEQKTAFHTCYSHFEYCVILFRLYNAPATFQQYINKALTGLINIFYIIYLNNILIFSKNKEDYKGYIYQVLDRLLKARLYYNLKKCNFNIK